MNDEGVFGVLSIGSDVIARCQFNAVGEYEETMIIIWSAEVGGNMIANADCKYAAVGKRHIPSDIYTMQT